MAGETDHHDAPLFDDVTTADPSAKRITAIAASRQNPLLAAVKVNKKSIATLPRKTIDQLRLAVGQPWDDQIAARVQQAVRLERARQAAMKLLNRRAMSTRQITLKLRQKGFEDDLIQQVTDRLVELKILDDRSLGETIVQTAQHRPAGPRLLRAKLRAVGLSPNLTDQLVKESQPQPEEAVEQAAALARTRLARMSSLPPPTRKRRLWGLLARRGFDPDTIERALHKLT